MALISIIGPHARCLAEELRPLLPKNTHWIDQTALFVNSRAVDWLMTQEHEGKGLWVMVGGWADAALYKDAPDYDFNKGWERWGEQVDIWINTGLGIEDVVPADAAWPPEAWAQYIQKLLEVQGVPMDES